MAALNVGIQKILLKDLHPNIFNGLIVGIIIGKQRPRLFANKKKNESDVRGVWSFTLRDSVQDYINVTCWADSNVVMHLNDEFHIGDVVEIIKPRIEIRKINDYGEQFRPMVTSPYTLTLSEPMAQLLKHNGDCTEFKKLLSCTTKPISSFLTLANILSSSTLNETAVDILVAVKNVGVVRSITPKSGSPMQVRDIIVFDNTNPDLKVTLWEPELIRMADNWKPRLTILFMTDVKVEYNNFFKTKTGTVTQRTIITENPSGLEAETLRNYAISAPLQPTAVLDSVAFSFPNTDVIQNVMTIQQIKSKTNLKINSVMETVDDQYFTGLVYAVVTKLNLDGQDINVSSKCSHCKSYISEQIGKCSRSDCPAALTLETVIPEIMFDIRLTLSDHTGTLRNCRLSSPMAESSLRCTVHEFLQMNDDEKIQLKWKFLLERCAVRLLVLCHPNRKPITSILNITSADPTEVANKLPHF